MSGARAIGLAWLGLSLGLVCLAATHVDRAGPYYDEAFMGQQAKDFFEPERGLNHPASTREVELFGRPFPLRNAVYLGATKSHALIPAFALFGPTLRVMRFTTLAISLLGLLATMAFARRVLGTPEALLAGALLAFDPAFYWFGLYEWGPVSVLLLARTLAMWLVVVGWQRRSALASFAAGVAMGTAVFARADIAVFALALGAAALAFWPRLLREAIGPRRGLVLAGAAGGLLGAAPMLLSVRDLLATSGSRVIASRGGFAEKLLVYRNLLDGSQFLRVVAAGGDFERARSLAVPGGAFGPVLGAAALAAVVRFGRRPLSQRTRVLGFLLVSGALVAGSMLAIPGAVRAHHLMNVYPLPHLLVAGVALAVWRAAGPALVLRRGVAAVLLALAFAGDAQMFLETRELLVRTGGRGRWSESIREVASRLEADPSHRGISLDWGLHEPLLFLTRKAQLLEPIWQIRPDRRARGVWTFDGRAGDVYVLHEEPFDLFQLGVPFMSAAERLEAREPGATTREAFPDREGGPAIVTITLHRDHRLRFDGRFRFE